MIHSALLVVAVYLVVLGIVICTFLLAFTVKERKVTWLITIPGIFIVAVLDIDFVCHVLHLPRQVVPYQKQALDVTHWILDAAMVPLVFIKLREIWLKRQVQTTIGETR